MTVFKYEMTGRELSSGRRLTVRANASSPSGAIRHAEKHGVTIDPETVKAVGVVTPAEPVFGAATAPPPLKTPPPPVTPSPVGWVKSHKPQVTMAALALTVVVAICGVGLFISNRRAAASPVATQGTPDGFVATGGTQPEPRHPADPLHTKRSAAGELTPDPGYAWTAGSGSAVQWVAGSSYPSYPHVVAAAEEGKWVPTFGYRFNSDATGDFNVHWVVGERLTEYPHVLTTATEGRCTTDDGYEFASSNENLAVKWKPGSHCTSNPHVFASAKEGYFNADPGYSFISPKNSLAVSWTPGATDYRHPHVTAASETDNWHPDAGYTWDNPAVAGDLSVHKKGPTDEQVKQAIVDVVAAGVANYAANSHPDPDEGLVAKLARQACLEFRDSAVNDALNNLFPDEQRGTLKAAANLLTMAMDGKLTADDWESANVHDYFVDRIRAQNPSAADAVEIADFISKAMAGYSKSAANN